MNNQRTTSPSLFPRPHPLTRRNGLVNQVEFLGLVQRRRRRSGWSGLGRITFQRGVLRLQRQCEDEMIWPGVPRKLASALRVRVSRNRSHSFAGGSRARRGPTGLHRHPRILFPQMVFAVGAHCLLWTGLHQHPRILIPQVVFTAAHCLL